ncbi:hypothetical protein [Rathayibacter tritici]|uniref:hypothetical protein n=1 Tax=Rathayibacter tritici TaxID=33888 RepID=UPI000CE8FD33|nr:hypothetical protein [Rathayibacter tritici]PPF66153.1 hypothetical protein C5C21_09700 [Rathayibacter tritici]
MSMIEICVFPSGDEDAYADVVATDYASVLDDPRESMVINALTPLAARGENSSTHLHNDGRISYEDFEGRTHLLPGRYDIGDLERAATSGWLRLEDPAESGGRAVVVTGQGLDHVNSIRARLRWAPLERGNPYSSPE